MDILCMVSRFLKLTFYIQYSQKLYIYKEMRYFQITITWKTEEMKLKFWSKYFG